jgi:hypothetical protein
MCKTACAYYFLFLHSILTFRGQLAVCVCVCVCVRVYLGEFRSPSRPISRDVLLELCFCDRVEESCFPELPDLCVRAQRNTHPHTYFLITRKANLFFLSEVVIKRKAHLCYFSEALTI